MGWATEHISRLQQGETVSFRPRGNSMTGKVESGQLVTVEPLTELNLKDLKTGDVVLCSVSGQQFLHLVKGIRKSGEMPTSIQIGNNKGGINGWTPATKVFGKCIKVED